MFQLQRDVWMHLAKPLCSLSTCSGACPLHVDVYLILHMTYCRCIQHVIVSAFDLVPIRRYQTLILHMCELFKFANLLKMELVSLHIPVVTVWVKIAAPNCHGKSRYGCDMK